QTLLAGLIFLASFFSSLNSTFSPQEIIMTTRIILAGILGGIAMFIWTSIAHMVLPLGEAGIGAIPNEQAVLSALQAGLGDKSGLFIFPGFGLGPEATREQ